MRAKLIITTGNAVEGREIAEYLDVVLGIVVRSPNIIQGIAGMVKAGTIGGNNQSFAKVCEQARLDAFGRMRTSAENKGADAIIAMRYDAAEFAPGITEVLAYGTAVKLKAAQPVKL